MMDSNTYIDFNKLWETKPFDTNPGGLNYYGMYAFWYSLNLIKPKIVIESGVYRGGSTWIIDNIDSVEKIICIDPLNKIWHPNNLLYISKKAEYTSVDFLEQDFKEFDLSAAVVFFDDHQDILPRLLHSKKLGIKNIIMDDNYRTLAGSHITLYCLQNLVQDENFKQIEIIYEINFGKHEKNNYISEEYYSEANNCNLTFIKIK